MLLPRTITITTRTLSSTINQYFKSMTATRSLLSRCLHSTLNPPRQACCKTQHIDKSLLIHQGRRQLLRSITQIDNNLIVLNHRQPIRGLKTRTLKAEQTHLPERFKMEWPKITLFGDSITRRSMDVDNGCWGSMVAFKTGSYFDVDARGFEGYNSKWGLELAPKLFPKSYLDKVEVFVLFFGHNDSWDLPPMHLSLEEYDQCMRGIIKHLTDNGLERRKIILITPTWFHDAAFQVYLKGIGMPPVTKKLEDCRKYSETVQKIGSDEQIEVLDFFSVSSKYEPLEEMFCDGVHLSRKGAKLLYDHLMLLIEKKVEQAFKKPLADLWHAVPFDQHPEMKPLIEAHLKGQTVSKE